VTQFDVTQYWSSPPPESSPRLGHWLKRIKNGFRPNKRLRSLGYHGRAEFYGVYIWEQLNVLDKALSQRPLDIVPAVGL
jgi:hypothetical protein